MGLIEFIANIGGLFGLWLGMSFIDMSEMIKHIHTFYQKYFKITIKDNYYKFH